MCSDECVFLQGLHLTYILSSLLIYYLIIVKFYNFSNTFSCFSNVQLRLGTRPAQKLQKPDQGRIANAHLRRHQTEVRRGVGQWSDGRAAADFGLGQVPGRQAGLRSPDLPRRSETKGQRN